MCIFQIARIIFPRKQNNQKINYKYKFALRFYEYRKFEFRLLQDL
jgi:hypothetical protein